MPSPPRHCFHRPPHAQPLFAASVVSSSRTRLLPLRTTLTIDDDVLAVSGRLAAARKVSTGQALSDLARRVQKVLLTEPQVTLGLLLEGITAENLHGEIDSGPPVGGEVW